MGEEKQREEQKNRFAACHSGIGCADADCASPQQIPPHPVAADGECPPPGSDAGCVWHFAEKIRAVECQKWWLV